MNGEDDQNKDRPIAAPPEVVWELLTDFPSWPQWNPSLVAISGDMVVGARLALTLQAGKRQIKLKPTVVQAITGAPRLGPRPRTAL